MRGELTARGRMAILAAAALAAISLATAASAARTVTFPHREGFDRAGAYSDIVFASQGCTTAWSGGTLRFAPGSTAGGYCGLRNFTFSPTKIVSVGTRILFTPEFVNGINQRFKHVIINRTSETNPSLDPSGHRGMTYVWRDASTPSNYTLGACQSTECIFEGGGTRPNASVGRFWLRQTAGKWLWIESVYNTVDHTVKVYVSTRDGAFRNYLLATRALSTPVPSAYDSWTRIDLIGMYLDLGFSPGATRYFALDEVRLLNAPGTAPANFFWSTASVSADASFAGLVSSSEAPFEALLRR